MSVANQLDLLVGPAEMTELVDHVQTQFEAVLAARKKFFYVSAVLGMAPLLSF